MQLKNGNSQVTNENELENRKNGMALWTLNHHLSEKWKNVTFNAIAFFHNTLITKERP